MSTTIVFNIAVEVFGSVLCLVFIACMLISDPKGSRPSRAFIRVLLCNIAVMLSDALHWISRGRTDGSIWFTLNFLGNYGTYFFSYLILMALSDYLVTYISTKVQIKRTAAHLSYAINLLAIALSVVALFNGMYFYIDEYNIYHRQDWYWLSQVLGLMSILVNAAVIIRYRRHYNRSEAFSLASYIVLPAVGVVIQMAVYGFSSVYVASTLSIVIIYIGMQSQQSRMLKEKELELAEGRIAIMLSQVQPHFLYNTLLAVKHLCSIDPEAAMEAIDEFAVYLRGNLDSLSQKKTLPLEDELIHTESYLALEKRRFQERLTIEYDIRERNFSLPALTLQPIVENAVRHGATMRREGGRVIIRTVREKNLAVITVEDNGPGFDPAQQKADGRSHVGLENVRNRVAAMCGGILTVHSTPGQGTVVEIRVPMQEYAAPKPPEGGTR